MSEFNPFITNDGSVGLYSEENQDIYHSVYGALTESWEKFIFPVDLNYFLKNNEKVNILDICYGIGYNTKCLMQYFINEISKNPSIIYSIYTDKNLSFKGQILSECNEKIYTDKIFLKKIFKKIKNIKKEKILRKNLETKKIFIDSVELDKNLLMLSPFIKNKFDYKNILEKDLPEIKKIKDKKIGVKKLAKKYLINDYVLKILFNKIINSEFIDLDFLEKTIFNSEYEKYFSQDIKRLFKSYLISKYKNTSESNKFAFLHNIYYEYHAKRYKKGLKTPYNNIFNLNLIYDDIINFLMGSDKTYDVVFLDAFTPTKCPKLWSIDFIKLIHNHLSDDGTVLTYSNSAQVRNAFLSSGFYVGKIFSKSNNKFMGTIATKNKNFIKHQLTQYDLGLIKTKAGIFYRDENFAHSNDEIYEAHKLEVENSNLMSSSKYIKLNKNIN